MIFFINFMYAFLGAIFLYFLFFNLSCSNENSTKKRYIFLAIIVSILIGASIQKIAIVSLYDSQSITIFRILAISGILFLLVSLLIKPIRYYLYLLSGIFLFLYSGAAFINSVKDFPLSGTNIINSELIINVTNIILAVGLCIFLAIAIIRLTKGFYSKFIVGIIFSISSFIFVLSQIGEVMLYAIRNDLIDLTKQRLSFVAKVTYFDYINIYIYLAFFIVLVILFFLNKTKLKTKLSLINARKLKKVVLLENRWIKSSLYSSIFILAFMLYYDLVASQPPTISEATILTPDKNDNFVINIEDVKDGDLYRYAYITDDGHKVRFLLINRFPDKPDEKVTAVFDACMICGDKGYIKQGNEVICIACNVRIFTPTIGKPGGCNPIPMKFTKKDGKVIISKEVILSGANYFSEIVPIKVEDIISKAKFLNTDAKFTYEYQGKTFYFESEENLNKFKKAPEKYAKDMVKRKWRVQGHEKGEK